MRDKLQHRTILDPKRLMKVKGHLRETAQIHATEERTHARPLERRRLAAIIEARPRKAARLPLARPVELPPLLGRLAPADYGVICVYGIAQRIGRVDSPRRDGAGGL